MDYKSDGATILGAYANRSTRSQSWCSHCKAAEEPGAQDDDSITVISGCGSDVFQAALNKHRIPLEEVRLIHKRSRQGRGWGRPSIPKLGRWRQARATGLSISRGDSRGGTVLKSALTAPRLHTECPL